jgi:manganese transport system ATP-binding protein
MKPVASHLAPSPTGSEPAVTITDAVFRYGSEVVFDRSSLAIEPGTITALIGPNGAGKSTLLNGIAGLIPLSEGRVELGRTNGRPLRLSYVLQDTKINQSLPVTVREVVSMGRYPGKGPIRPLSKRDRQLVDKVMERTNISHLAKRHLSRLSGGQRHRVLLAQGLVQDHEILLLDEPATGLDLVSIQAIRDTVREEANIGCTVILTTHDMADAWTADYVVLLAGRVVTSGPPEEVLQSSHLIEAYGTALLNVDGTHLLLDDPHHDHPDSHQPTMRSISVETWEWLREEIPRLLGASPEDMIAGRDKTTEPEE